jgi:hypothetical protein
MGAAAQSGRCVAGCVCVCECTAPAPFAPLPLTFTPSPPNLLALTNPCAHVPQDPKALKASLLGTQGIGWRGASGGGGGR